MKIDKETAQFNSICDLILSVVLHHVSTISTSATDSLDAIDCSNTASILVGALVKFAVTAVREEEYAAYAQIISDELKIQLDKTRSKSTEQPATEQQ